MNCSPAITYIPAGGRALLRIAGPDVTEHQTLAVIGFRLGKAVSTPGCIRDQDGNNLEFRTDSITPGGESLDVILDAGDEGCRSMGLAISH
jgi:hypothetical protein